MNRSLRVCLAQINTTVGDFKSNREKIIQVLAEAKNNEADLAVFPELTLTGYPPEDLLLKKEFVKKSSETLFSILPHTKGILAVVGFAEGERGGLYNSAALIFNGKIEAVYRKNHLPNYGVFDEKRYFTPGDKNLLLDSHGIRLGISICEDIWQKDSFFYSREYRDQVSALINISASPYHMGKERERELLVCRLARQTNAPVIYQNLVGGQDELVFDGGSMAVDQKGKVLARAGLFEEKTIFVDLPVKVFSSPAKSSAILQAFRANEKLFAAKTVKKKIKTRPLFHSLSREEEVYKALVMGTRDYVRKNGFQKVLIGLSGGIDSAIVACIAADALGPEDVIGVTLPSRFTSQETYLDAKQIAQNLGIPCLEFKIDTIFTGYLEILQKAFEGKAENCAEENLQARIRGNILMALSNKFGHLVLTTGNKSEMATGYSTLYGDMAGGFAVIKDVPKTLVYKIAAYRNGLVPKKVIPDSIIQRPPTAELRFGQKDEDSLPPYSLLDRFLESYVEKDLPISQASPKGMSGQIALQMSRKVDQNEYKRRQSPPGIKITPKAFGRDRRMPITNRYNIA